MYFHTFYTFKCKILAQIHWSKITLNFLEKSLFLLEQGREEDIEKLNFMSRARGGGWNRGSTEGHGVLIANVVAAQLT